MKFLIVIVAMAVVASAAPSGLLGHGLGLAGPLLGGSALAGPHVGPGILAGPVAGPVHVSGAAAGPVVVSGAVAAPSAVIGSVDGGTLISEPSLGLSALDLGLGLGHGAILAGGHLGALHGGYGPVLVAGPDGATISRNGLGLGAVITGAHGHLGHW